MAKGKPPASIRKPPPAVKPLEPAPEVLDAFVSGQSVPPAQQTPVSVPERLQTSADVHERPQTTERPQPTKDVQERPQTAASTHGRLPGSSIQRDKGERRRLTLYLPPDVAARLGKFCEAEGREMSATVTRAVVRFLEAEGA